MSFRKPVLVGETVRTAIKVTGKNRTINIIVLVTEIRDAGDTVVVSGSAKVKIRDTNGSPLPELSCPAAGVAAKDSRVALVTGASRGLGAEIVKTLALAVEWAEDQIRVNMVSPGLTHTELTQHYQERVFKMEASRTPLRRTAQPADIANAAAFLLSGEAAFLTGINLPVTGGQVMT